MIYSWSKPVWVSSVEHKRRYFEDCGEKKHLLVAIDFHCIDSSNKSMATGNSLVTNNLQNILFCVEQKKETHTGMEQV